MAEKPRFTKYPSLVDRVVVISGGATGIGASLVLEFARQGAKVIFMDIQVEAAEDLIKSLEAEKVTNLPLFFRCDVTNVDDDLKPTATKILETYPKIHGLINNAASDKRQSTLGITTSDWDQGIAVNLRHQFFLTQALMPGLLASGTSSVINMGSINWVIPGIGLVPYSASKSAVVGLTKTLAHEFGPQGVRVNSIMPGGIWTERQEKEIWGPGTKEWILGKQALKFLLKGEDVARMALWLIADDSSAVTNQSIVVDAGFI